MSDSNQEKWLVLLERLTEAVERLSPSPSLEMEMEQGDQFIWHSTDKKLVKASHPELIPWDCLCGIDEQKKQLLENTQRLQQGLPSHHALLWGARGMGKSSLVQAVHRKVNEKGKKVILVQLRHKEIDQLDELLSHLAEHDNHPFIIFCDDLAFDNQNASTHAFKEVLEGGLMMRPSSFLLYATSNLRHLQLRDNSSFVSRIDPHERDALDDNLSLSDRFGLWLGFHPCDEATWHEMLRSYAAHWNIVMDDEELLKQAHAWAMKRGGRSGRLASQWARTQGAASR